MATKLDRGNIGALARVRQILRRDGALTRDEFEELDLLFDDISTAQLAQLSDDPAYDARLTRYHAFLREQALPIVGALAFAFAVSAAMGVWLSFTGH